MYSLRVRYDDATKVDKITDDIRAFFESHPGVDHKLPYKAALSDLATYSVDISITVRPRCHSQLCIVPYLTCRISPHTSCFTTTFLLNAAAGDVDTLSQYITCVTLPVMMLRV